MCTPDTSALISYYKKIHKNIIAAIKWSEFNFGHMLEK